MSQGKDKHLVSTTEKIAAKLSCKKIKQIFKKTSCLGCSNKTIVGNKASVSSLASTCYFKYHSPGNTTSLRCKGLHNTDGASPKRYLALNTRDLGRRSRVNGSYNQRNKKPRHPFDSSYADELEKENEALSTFFTESNTDFSIKDNTDEMLSDSVFDQSLLQRPEPLGQSCIFNTRTTGVASPQASSFTSLPSSDSGRSSASDAPPYDYCQNIMEPSDVFHLQSSMGISHKRSLNVTEQKHGELKIAVYLNCGLLTVHVVKAKNLEQQSFSSWSFDTFVKLSLAPDFSMRSFCKTNVVHDTTSPTFDEKFSFELRPSDVSKRLLISLWQLDKTTKRSTVIGCMSFGLQNLSKTGKVTTGWYYLLDEAIGRSKHLNVLKSSQKEGSLKRQESSTSWAEKKNFTISRGPEGFGFAILGSNPVLISKVSEPSQAEVNGLRVDDVITRVNGQNVAHASSEDVANIIKNCHDSITLDVLRPIAAMTSQSKSLQPRKRHHSDENSNSLNQCPRLHKSACIKQAKQNCGKLNLILSTNSSKLSLPPLDDTPILLEEPSFMTSQSMHDDVLNGAFVEEKSPCPLSNQGITLPGSLRRSYTNLTQCSRHSYSSSEATPRSLRIEDLREESRFSDSMYLEDLACGIW